MRGFSALEGVAVWIAHNADDDVVPLSDALEAARKIEQVSGETFLHSSPTQVGVSDYLSRQLVFTSDATGGHDAWTDLYTNPELYRWLLVQGGSR